jgi:hypothetical protein
MKGLPTALGWSFLFLYWVCGYYITCGGEGKEYRVRVFEAVQHCSPLLHAGGFCQAHPVYGGFSWG